MHPGGIIWMHRALPHRRPWLLSLRRLPRATPVPRRSHGCDGCGCRPQGGDWPAYRRQFGSVPSARKDSGGGRAAASARTGHRPRPECGSIRRGRFRARPARCRPQPPRRSRPTTYQGCVRDSGIARGAAEAGLGRGQKAHLRVRRHAEVHEPGALAVRRTVLYRLARTIGKRRRQRIDMRVPEPRALQ